MSTKEGRSGQTPAHLSNKAKLKMMTLGGQQLSNKNININISYNLTEKGNRGNGSANELEFSGSGTQTPSSAGKMECFGRRVAHNDVLITENANRSPKPTARKSGRRPPADEHQDIVSNECEISIRVVNKQRQRRQATQSKGRKLEHAINIELKEERQHPATYSNPCSPSKYHSNPIKSQTMRKPLKVKRGERRLTEKVAMQTQKTQPYAKTEQPQQLKPRTQNLPAAQFTKLRAPYEVKKDLGVGVAALKVNNYRQSMRPECDKDKDKNSGKQSSSKKRACPSGVVPPQPPTHLSTLERKLLRRIVKVSQLSYASQSEVEEVEPTRVENGRRVSEQESMNYAADTIKLYWRQFRKSRVLKFYESVFRKNTRAESTDRQLPEELEFNAEQLTESYFVESQHLSVDNSIKVVDSGEVEAREDNMGAARLELLKHRQSSSGNIEEEDSQFNINKYHLLEADLHDHILEDRPKQHKVEVIDLKSFRQHQIQQWSGLKDLIRRRLEEGQCADAQELLKQLIEQTELNKKWIESGVAINRTTSQESSRKSEQNRSQLALSNLGNYRQLVQEKGIADKIFKDSVEVHKKVLEKEENLIKSKRSSHKSSLSDNSMGSQHVRHSSCDELDTFKEGRGSLTSQFLESQSRQQQSQDQADHNKASESINSYLDCGLGQFEFKQRLVQLGEADEPIEPLGRNFDSDSSLQERSQQLSQAEEDQEFEDTPQVDRHAYSFEQIYDLVLLEFSQELHRTERMEINLKRSFLNVPAHRPQVEPSRKQLVPGIRCGQSSIREYLTGFIHFILRTSHYAHEVTKNLNYVLGPSSREILFYLRIDSDENDIDFVEEEGYIFAIPLSTFESYELSLPLSTSEENSLEAAMMSHHWHRAIFEALNESLDSERPYGAFGKPYLWSKSSRVSRKVITRALLPLAFRSAVNRLLQMVSLPCGIMFDLPECPYYGSQLFPDEKAKINEDRISLMLADELFENQPNLTTYDDETTEVLLEMVHYAIDKLLFDTAIELRKLRRVRSFME